MRLPARWMSLRANRTALDRKELLFSCANIWFVVLVGDSASWQHIIEAANSWTARIGRLALAKTVV